LSNTIYVEYANRAFSRDHKNYERLMQSIADYPEPNHDSFNIEIFPPSDDGSNTYSLFIYGYKVNVNLILIFEGNNEYLGKVLCRLGSKEIISEFYIDNNGDLINEKDAAYPRGHFGQCGKLNTATKFLITIAKKLIEKTIPTP
jgi:hypothetical protein